MQQNVNEVKREVSTFVATVGHMLQYSSSTFNLDSAKSAQVSCITQNVFMLFLGCYSNFFFKFILILKKHEDNFSSDLCSQHIFDSMGLYSLFA